jgi:hypothetical protein
MPETGSGLGGFGIGELIFMTAVVMLIVATNLSRRR